MSNVEKEIVALFKSGNFTIAFHDQAYCCIYKGKFDYENLPEQEDYSIDMGSGSEGYSPDVVLFLTKALKGRCVSI
jgi:hypothetical protein